MIELLKEEVKDFKNGKSPRIIFHLFNNFKGCLEIYR